MLTLKFKYKEKQSIYPNIVIFSDKCHRQTAE